MRILTLPAAALFLFGAACGSSGGASPASSPADSPAPAAAVTATPAASTADAPSPQAGGIGAYLALGDSISAGAGASVRAETAFVPLVAAGLGAPELINLGVSGDTSGDLLNGGPLDEGMAEIQRRATDGVAGNEVSVITLEIGGNDLLNLYFDLVVPGVCPSLKEGLANPKCVDGLQGALDAYRPNLREALLRLNEAAPDVPVFLLTIYNPFSGAAARLDEAGRLALEGEPGTVLPEGLNDIIREEGEAAGAVLVDIYPLFLGRANEYIFRDLLHPNDAGYRVMAGAVLEAMRASGLR